MKLLGTIKRYGYTEVVVRPSSFQERRFDSLTGLQKVVRAAQVRIRGWPFPCVDEAPPSFGEDYIAFERDWEWHRETWRFYQSGMFVAFLANRADLDAVRRSGEVKPGTVLSVGDTVFQFCEVFEFASRLALSMPGGDAFHIELRLHRLKGRRLFVDLWRQRPGAQTQALSWPFSGDYPRAQLSAESRPLAFAAASDLFQRFGWEASSQVLQGILDCYGK
jgi:hypothetical protein